MTYVCDAYKIVVCLMTLSRHNERLSPKYHFGAVRGRQMSALTKAPAVHIGAGDVGGTQQCKCYSFQFHVYIS